MALSSPGVGSNLDVNSLVSQLMAVERQPLTALARKEAGFQTSITAYGTIKGALSSLQSAASALALPGAFRAMTASVADPSVFGASAQAGAAAGTYAVAVSQLAQAQSIYAAGQTSTSAAIGAGASTTLQFQFGAVSGGSLAGGRYTGATFTQDTTQAGGTVTITSSNNTLAGIRDAINAAAVGVTATIVNDGSAAPYRLVLTSNATGASSAMKITVSGDASIGSLLAYDPAATQNPTQSAAAQSASLTVNNIAVTSASNTVSGAIQGVTLNLAKAGTSNMTIASDAASVQAAVQKFVKAYNDAAQTIAGLTAYDPVSKLGGQLLGDSTTQRVQDALRRVLSTAISGTGGNFTVLSQAGVSFQKDGTLTLDSTKLQNAISSNLDGVTRLFATVGSSTDAQTTFVSAGAATRIGSHAVSVTALATQGVATGSLALGGSTVIGSGNNQITLSVDGITGTATLAQGTYTAAQLASALQTAINGTASFASAGAAVAVSQSGGILSVTSGSYGTSSAVSVTGGNGIATLFGTPASTAGTNVAGTIDGAAATGAGQVLTGAAGGAADGLKISITGGATGDRGSVNFSRGYGDLVNTTLDNVLGSSGTIATRTAGLQKSVAGIGQQRDALNLRLTGIEARYRAQFAALDQLVSSLNKTSSFLTQQLANMPKIGGNNNN